MNGAELICATLRALGADTVFGLPGTQNIALYEALRSSRLRSVVASDEGAAAFMANGYARASGRPGVLTTIPGPGFLYALPGIAEAREDSAPLLWITLRARPSEQAFALQSIDQRAIAAPLVKQTIVIERVADLVPGLGRAWRAALEEEPGPVMVELGATLLADTSTQSETSTQADTSGGTGATPSALPAEVAAPLLARLRDSSRPVIIAGQGAQGVAPQVRELVRAAGIPVIPTCSGRGVLADDDPWSFVQDFSMGMGTVVPALLQRADLVLALGCKFTHNGSCGGRLMLPREKLARIDSSAAVLASNYPASLAVHARLEQVLPLLLAAGPARKDWDASELGGWQAQLAAERARPIEHEPLPDGLAGGRLESLFDALGRVLGDGAIYTADAGLHQLLARRYAVVRRARGMLCPSDFQSMGFGLPGAIGAALAQPDAHVVACIGDGGLALSAGELLTAVRERVRVSVVVFNDQSYGLIRRQQVANFGHASGIGLANPDFATLAQAIGCNYLRVAGDATDVALAIAAAPGVTLIELQLADAPSFESARFAGVVKARLRQAVPQGAWQTMKRLLRR